MPRFRFFVSALISGALFGVLPLGQYAAWAECPAPGDSVPVPTFCVTRTSDDAVNPEEGSLRSAVIEANGQLSSEIRFSSSLYEASMAEIKLTAPLQIDSNIQIIGPELKLVDGQPAPIPQIVISRDPDAMTAESSMIEISQNKEVKIERVIIESAEVAGHAIEIKGDSTTEVRSVLTVEQSIIANASSGSSGAAISTPGTVNIVESTLTNNVSQGEGGAIAAGGTVNVVNSTVTNNSSEGNGGAIRSNSDVAISNTLLENNVSSGVGGGVAAGGDVTVSHSGVLDNTATGDGGAIYAEGEIRVEDNSLIDGNRSLEGEGGALKSENTVTVMFSEISNNQSGSSGGAISAPQVLVNIEKVEIDSKTVLAPATVPNEGTSTTTFSGNNAGINPVVSDLGEANRKDSFDQRAGSGGAISAETVTTSQTTFSGNTAIAGGAISVSNSVEISNSTFTTNLASDGYGGAIDIGDSSLESSTIKDSTFSSNSSDDGGAIDGNGGGVDLEVAPESTPKLTVEGSTFTQNEAAGTGGAIYQIGIVDVKDSVFTANSALEGDGGAIYAENTTQISGSTFQENSTGADGGAISASGKVEVSSTTFLENLAERRGGAIHSNREVSATSSEFRSNESLSGGAISSDGDVTVAESTFVSNSALNSNTEIILSDSEGVLKDGQGGAIYAKGATKIVNSNFDSNLAEESGGAVSSQILLVNSSTFENNSATRGGAVEVLNESRIVELTESQGEYSEDIETCIAGREPDSPEDVVAIFLCILNFDKAGNSVVMNSLFNGNAATGEGSAIYGPTWLLFNTITENSSTTGGSSIDLRSNLMTMLFGNLMISNDSESLCAIPFDFSLRNLVSDESCIAMEDALTELAGDSASEILSLVSSSYMAGSEQGFVQVGTLEELSSFLMSPQNFQSLIWYWMGELRGFLDPFELLLPTRLMEAQSDYLEYFNSDEYEEGSEVHRELSKVLLDGEFDLIRGIFALVLGLTYLDPELIDPFAEMDPAAQSIWRNAGEFLTFISEYITTDLIGNPRYADKAWSAGAIETTLLLPKDESDKDTVKDSRSEEFDSEKEVFTESTKMSNWIQQAQDDLRLKLEEAEKARISAKDALDNAKKEAKLDRAKKRESLRAKTLEIATKVRATKTSNVKVSVKVQFNKGSKRANRFGAVAV